MTETNNPFDKPLVYTAQSKIHFFCRDAVAQYVIENGAVPLHPFKLFDYFLSDRVPRDDIRDANNTIVHRADEIWVFGSEIANGVLIEIDYALAAKKPIKLFSIATRAKEIQPISINDLTFEDELLDSVDGDIEALMDVIKGKSRFSTLYENI